MTKDLILNNIELLFRWFVYSLILIVPVLFSVAFFTLTERKVMGYIQRRLGPDVTGYQGLLQPLADGLKLILKESIIPAKSNVILFTVAPFFTFFISLVNWSIIPIAQDQTFMEVYLGSIFILAMSSLNVYGVIIAGWSSNSRYAFLGSIRSAAQMISYEIAMGFILATVALVNGTYNLFDIIMAQKYIWNVFILAPLFIVFLIVMLAETNRAPFDLPEAEAELVAGFNVEYSGIMFALFFLAEYSNMIVMAIFTSIIFLGGWWFPYPFTFLNEFKILSQIIYITKILVLCNFYIQVRASLPRYRYDQLMSIGWKIFLPFTFGYFVFIVGFLTLIDGLPEPTWYPFMHQDTILILDILDQFNIYESYDHP